MARLLSNCLLPGEFMDQLLDDVQLLEYLDQRMYSSDGAVKKPIRGLYRIGEGAFWSDG